MTLPAALERQIWQLTLMLFICRLLAGCCLGRMATTEPKLTVYNGPCLAWQCLLVETLLRIPSSDVLV